MIDPRSLLAGKPRRRRRLTIGALVAIVLGVFFALTSGRGPAPPPKLPDPNGYDDLVKAGQLVKGPWPGNGEFAKIDPAEIRPFLEAHKPTLDLARVGLARECMVPIEDSQVGLGNHAEAIGPIRTVGRLLLGEARVAEADGRIADALKAYRDMLALGLAVTQGGMSIDLSVGAAIHYQAIRGIRQLRDRLPRDGIAPLVAELESLDRRLVTPDAAEERWFRWYQASWSPWTRFLMQRGGIEQSTRKAERKVTEALTIKTRRDLRFLLVELAIHAHHLDKGTWPRSAAELVPAYLPAVPVDPATNQPLNYPTNPAGELTGNLADVARPDGSIAPPAGSKP